MCVPFLPWCVPGVANTCLQIQPGGVEVDHIAAEVSNGEVWVLNGVLNYQ